MFNNNLTASDAKHFQLNHTQVTSILGLLPHVANLKRNITRT